MYVSHSYDMGVKRPMDILYWIVNVYSIISCQKIIVLYVYKQNVKILLFIMYIYNGCNQYIINVKDKANIRLQN